ncbi:nicotinamide mononucleotide (NMN) deamidase PncC [Kitasatospora herbaricolor]|nr:nicotinamide mononucleotide (NMN) deamidase PncC [Kitasatospora herbaricolor]
MAPDLLDSRGPVDGEVAQQMAQGVRTLMRAPCALATAGFGPALHDHLRPSESPGRTW